MPRARSRSRRDPGPAPTVAGDGRRAADQRERQGDRLGRTPASIRGRTATGRCRRPRADRRVARLGRPARRRARAVRDPSRRQARRRPLIRARFRTRGDRGPRRASSSEGPRLHLIRAHRTPDAARRQRAHLPRILRPPAPDDVEGRARQRRLRLLQHRPARHRGHQAGLRRGRLRPPGPDLPPRAVRRVQGDPPAHAGRPARPVPQGPRGGQGAAHPRLRAGGLRGRRRHRHDHRRRRAARPRHDDRDRRPRHAPARHRPHPADDHAVGRREHDPLRPGPDRRAVRPRARAR